MYQQCTSSILHPESDALMLYYNVVMSCNILDDDNHNDDEISDKYDQLAQFLIKKSFLRCRMKSVIAVRCLCSQ